MQQKPPQLQ